MKDYYYERVENHHYNRIHTNTNSKIYARSRRAQELRIAKYLLMTLFFIIITFSIIFSIKKATYANENQNENLKKQYKSITIYCGDSLESIAENNISVGYSSTNKLVSEICHINHISESVKLIPGNYLVIPYYEEINTL